MDEGFLEPKVVYGYFPVQSDGNDLIVYHVEEFDCGKCACGVNHANRIEAARRSRGSGCGSTSPARKAGGCCASADFFRSAESGQFDVLGVQLVTVGDKATELANELSRRRTNIRITSTCTASASSPPRPWPSSGTSASARNSASAPKTPRTSTSSSTRATEAVDTASAIPRAPTWKMRTKVIELLEPDAIGVALTENFMLVPEQSTDALIAHHPQAKYFDVK